MTTISNRTARRGLLRDRPRMRATLSTVPIVIASSLAMSMNLSGPIALQPERSPERDGGESPSQLRENVRAAFASASHSSPATPVTAGTLALASTPASYTVQEGDSISGIAGQFGLSTASVLALNGLGWKSVIHPGQVLVLAKNATAVAAAPSAPGGSYTIAPGDTISSIAAKFNASTNAVLAANGLTTTSIIYPGQRISVPAPGSASPAATSAAQPRTAVTHTIAAGDTVTSIARQHGVSTSALLSANGLSASSTIYAGQTLQLPAIQPAGTVPISASAVVPLTPEMLGHARTIVAVGRSLGVDDEGIVIALAAAAQESTLRNLDWGDLDSVGLFQQRPSAGWGSVAQLTSPEYAARLFYGGAKNPNQGNTRGLLDIPGWRSMTLTQAAQAVQLSAFPEAYAKWETSARSWLVQIG